MNRVVSLSTALALKMRGPDREHDENDGGRDDRDARLRRPAFDDRARPRS